MRGSVRGRPGNWPSYRDAHSAPRQRDSTYRVVPRRDQCASRFGHVVIRLRRWLRAIGNGRAFHGVVPSEAFTGPTYRMSRRGRRPGFSAPRLGQGDLLADAGRQVASGICLVLPCSLGKASEPIGRDGMRPHWTPLEKVLPYQTAAQSLVLLSLVKRSVTSGDHV